MKDIIGYENHYQVTSTGRVWSSKSEKWLALCNSSCGYILVSLCKNGKQKSYRVHRLVADAFLEKKENHTEVNHKDKNRTNNRMDNLEWCTRKENIAHQYKNTARNNKERKVKSLIRSGVSKKIAEYAVG